eukprot:gene12869-15114_t
MRERFSLCELPALTQADFSNIFLSVTHTNPEDLNGENFAHGQNIPIKHLKRNSTSIEPTSATSTKTTSPPPQKSVTFSSQIKTSSSPTYKAISSPSTYSKSVTSPVEITSPSYKATISSPSTHNSKSVTSLVEITSPSYTATISSPSTHIGSFVEITSPSLAIINNSNSSGSNIQETKEMSNRVSISSPFYMTNPAENVRLSTGYTSPPIYHGVDIQSDSPPVIIQSTYTTVEAPKIHSIETTYATIQEPKAHSVPAVVHSPLLTKIGVIHSSSNTSSSSIGQQHPSNNNGDGFKSYTVSYIADKSSSSAAKPPAFACHKCKSEIWGTTIFNAVGDKFHPHCFQCYICKGSLMDGYFQNDTGYLCASCQVLLNDQNKQARANCGHCSICYKRFDPNEKHISIDREKYHPQCFKCACCKQVIGDQSFSRDRVTSTISNYCCDPCLNSGRADRCPECKNAIVGGASIFALNKTYHPQCFKYTLPHHARARTTGMVGVAANGGIRPPINMSDSPAAPATPVSNAPVASPSKLFVGNLAFSLKESDLTERFSVYGTVVSSRIITKRNASLGYGFVEMDTEESALKAIEGLNKVEIDGRAINVELTKERSAEPRPPREPKVGGTAPAKTSTRKPRTKKPANGTNPTSPSTAAPLVDGKPAAPKKRRSPVEKKPERSPRSTTPKQPSNSTVYVTNIPFSVTDEQLLAIFAEYNPKSAHVIINNKFQKSKGYGFVEFNNSNDQQNALNVNKKEIEGRELSVKIALVGTETPENAGETSAVAPAETN